MLTVPSSVLSYAVLPASLITSRSQAVCQYYCGTALGIANIKVEWQMHQQRRYETTVWFQFGDIVIQLLTWIRFVKVLCDDVPHPYPSYGAHC